MSSVSTDRRQGVNAGMAFKVPCRVASTANLVLSGEQTIDGVACVTGDRVLVKNQNTGADNGIYVVDSGDWDRDVDADGSYNLTTGSLVRVNAGSSNAGGIFALTTATPITIGTTALTFARITINYVVHERQVAIAGQTVFNLGTAYQIAANGIAIYVNGLRVSVDVDYTETTATRVTFLYQLAANDQLDFYIGQAQGNLTAAQASLVAITDAADYFVAVTVEAALQELVDAITPDNGDADVNLTWGASTPVQRWNAALTANRSASLQAANAKEGSHFLIIRGSGATGNFTLLATSGATTLATLRAPGEWARVRYDAGTATWILEAYGLLPSAEVRAVSADNGDASVNLTIGTSERTQRWATALTAERTADLQATSVHSGARFRIERMETASGGFALAVKTGASVLARLATGQWCEVEHTGAAWIVVGFGNLRQNNPAFVQLRDDFLGWEIDGYRWQSLIGTDPSCSQAIVRADQAGGVVRLTTGADAGATMALNGTQMQSQLNWRADKGVFEWEGRVSLDVITNVVLYIGLTDQDSALEMPFTLAAGDALTSNASDACGVLFDTAADTDNWWLVGVKADIDAAKQNSALAPVAATFETWRIEVDATGQASFYRNGTLIGVVMVAAVGPAVLLTPVVAAFARGAASRNVDVDFLGLQQQR